MSRYWRCIFDTILLLATLTTTFAANAQGAFGAPLGPRSVGYRSEWIADETRNFDVPDEHGMLHASPRYIHVHLWYPSVANTGQPMTLQEYFDPGEASGVPKFLIDLIAANDFGTPTYSFRSIFKDDTSKLDQALRTRVSARSWAEPAAGRFPVVIHIVGQNDFTQDAVLYAEYLASRGYIVATVPYLGTSARRSPLLVHDPWFYENLLRDAEVALTQKALKLKSADRDRVFATGHSYGGIYALLLAMRSPAIKGVIGLDPTYISKRNEYEYDLRKFPFWSAVLSVPIITLRRQSQQTDETLVNDLPRSQKLEIVYQDVLHGDYASVPFWKRTLPESMQIKEEIAVRSPEHAAAGATQVFKQVANLLDALSAGRTPVDAVISDPAIEQKTSTSPATQTPTVEDVYWNYRDRGMEDAKRLASKLSSTEEPDFIRVAKEASYYGRNVESVDLFRLLRETFPNSATAQVAAAKGLLNAGKKEEAMKAAESALRIDPTSSDAREILGNSAPR